MDNDRERLKKALDSMIFLPHLKDRQTQNSLASLLPDSKVTGGVGRPWDKGDLFRRLQTFRASTWFAKPDALSAAECARHGWENTGVDMLTCESCKATVNCPVPPQLMPSEARKAAEKYSKKLTDAHEVACPWRSTSCSLSLLNFPELPRSAVSLDFKERSSAIQRLVCLPPMAEGTVTRLLSGELGAQVATLLVRGPLGESSSSEKASTGIQKIQGEDDQAHAALIARLVNKVATNGEEIFTQRVRLLTLCGLTLKTLDGMKKGPAAPLGTPTSPGGTLSTTQILNPESCTLACDMCGAKAGLWNNFPESQPQVCPADLTLAPGSGADPKASSGFSTAAPIAARVRPSGQPPKGLGNGGGLPSRYVAFDLSSTIAGGEIRSVAPLTDNNPTPFGSSQSAFPVFGAPPTSTTHPPATGEGAPQSQSAVQPEATPTPRPHDNIPVFGFAALRAKEPGANSPPALAANAKRQRIADALAAPGLPTRASASVLAPAEKRLKLNNGTSSEPVNTAARPAAPPTAAVLQRYRSMATVPLDPIAIHRPFCPWVHAAHAAAGAGEGESVAGWEWCVQQLVPGAGKRGGETRGAGDQEGDDSERDGVAWNPSQILRNVLAKVEVKK